MSTHTLQPLIWLARRCRSSWLIGTRARLIDFESACSASIAPWTAKAGLVMRAVIDMDEFEAHRPHLHAVATRLLGSRAEADDALQEAWIRIERADTSEVENLAG